MTMPVSNSPIRTLLRWRTRDRGQGPSTRPPPYPARSGKSQPPSADSSISVEELSIDTPKQNEGPTHCTVINQEQDDADSLASTQARRFQQDPACSEVRFQDFGDVRVQDIIEVRI